MTPQVLRPYQEEMLQAIQSYLTDREGNGIVVSPTGTGKSLVSNATIKWAVEEFGVRVMCITHDRNIIAQNCDSMIRYWPQADAGIYSAGLKQWSTRNAIIYCGIQSVYKCPEEFGVIDLLIIDECHMLSPKEGTMYSKVLHALRRVNPELRVLGYSASPYRMGQGLLTEGDVFNDIIIDLTKCERFCQFVEEGYLSPLHTKKTSAEIDLKDVPMSMGDFSEKEMQLVADTTDLNKCVVLECIKHGRDRKHWLGFSSGIQHAEHLCQTFKSYGISCVVIHGTMGVEERDRLTNDFRAGKIRCVVNCGIFNVGWDFPELDLIFVARGTQSTSWWVQCLGRGTRAVYAVGYPIDTVEERLAAIKAGPKPDGCLVLDFAGNTRRLGPVNDPVIPHARRKGDDVAGSAPVKVCPECDEYNHTRATVCVNCGYQFPPSSCIEGTASRDEVMVKAAQTPEYAIMSVLSTHYSDQNSKDPSWGRLVKISYGDLTKSVSEYHFPSAPLEWKRREFAKLWVTAGGQLPVPHDSENFLERARKELKSPVRVTYTSNKKYPDVVKREYA